MKTLPVIGRYSNEQTHFIRRTNYKRSDFEQNMPRVTFTEAKAYIAIVIAIVIAGVAWRFAA